MELAAEGRRVTRWALRAAIVLLLPSALLLLVAAVVAIPGAGLACAAWYVQYRKSCSADRSTRAADYLRHQSVTRLDSQRHVHAERQAANQRAAIQPAEQGLRPDRGREGRCNPFAVLSRPPGVLIEWPPVERKGKWGES